MIGNLVGVAIVGTAGSSWFSAFLEIHLADSVRETTTLKSRICSRDIQTLVSQLKRAKKSTIQV
jgi:hypothetical protein